MDISSPVTKRIGGNGHWLLVIDYCTDNVWSFFLNNKSDQNTELLVFIKDLKAKYNTTMENIQGNNQGDNQALEQL